MSSLVTIPVGSVPGQENMFIPSPYQRGSNTLPYAPIDGVNQTIGWTTNDRVTYPFEMQLLREKGWTEPLETGMFCFLARSHKKALLTNRSATNSRRSTLLTLPLVNYFLAANPDKMSSFSDVDDFIQPIGVVGSHSPENRPSHRQTAVVLNVIVKGNSESTHNLWGAFKNYLPYSKVYFKVVKRKLLPGESLSFTLGLQNSSLSHVNGEGQEILQLVPHVATAEKPPALSESVLGYWYVGRIVQTSTVTDIYGQHQFDDVDALSRSTADIISKSKQVQLFIN